MSHYRGGYDRERIMDTAQPRESAEEDGQVHLDDAELIHYGLSRISSADRELLTLFFLRDLSIDEVAEVLLIPPGTVKSRLFKAKKTLRDVLEREGRCDG